MPSTVPIASDRAALASRHGRQRRIAQYGPPASNRTELRPEGPVDLVTGPSPPNARGSDGPRNERTNSRSRRLSDRPYDGPSYRRRGGKSLFGCTGTRTGADR